MSLIHHLVDFEDPELRQPHSAETELLHRYAAGHRDFEAIELSQATLEQAVLTGADLSYGDFSQANLRGAHLKGCDFSYADLTNADLTGADLRGSSLLGANLHGAILDQANLERADYDSFTGFDEGFDPAIHGMNHSPTPAPQDQ